MAFELKDGQGSLFRVTEKPNERGPDYEGKANIGGTVYRIAGWLKEGKNGKWMSLSIEEPRAALEKPAPAKVPDDDENSIPF